MFGIGEEPKSHKYLPEQRLAYAYLGGVGLILLGTGVVKVIKNLPGVLLPPGLITSMTLTHTFATIFFLLGVMAHLAALIFKVNRPLVRSIFTRDVDLDYVRDRHTVWYDELMRNKVKEKEVKAKAEVEVKDKVKEEKGQEIKVVTGFVEREPTREEEMMANVVKVKGMSCQHCVMSITKALNQLEGVKNVNVDLQKGEVRFENTKGVASAQIEKAIVDAGYEVIPQSA
jgi:copper ion binding protein